MATEFLLLDIKEKMASGMSTVSMDITLKTELEMSTLRTRRLTFETRTGYRESTWISSFFYCFH